MDNSERPGSAEQYIFGQEMRDGGKLWGVHIVTHEDKDKGLYGFAPVGEYVYNKTFWAEQWNANTNQVI